MRETGQGKTAKSEQGRALHIPSTLIPGGIFSCKLENPVVFILHATDAVKASPSNTGETDHINGYLSPPRRAIVFIRAQIM